MKRIALIVLLLALTLVSILNAEIVYNISEVITLPIPYPYDKIISQCDEDTLLHFYSSIQESDNYNLYHFTLNSNMQFSERDLIVSIDAVQNEIDSFKIIDLFEDTTFHIHYKNNYLTKLVVIISNYDELSNTVDISQYEQDLADCYSITAGTLVLKKSYRDEFNYRHSDFYKLDLATSELSLFQTYSRYADLYQLGNEILIDDGTGYMKHFDTNLEYIDSLTISDEGNYDWYTWFHSFETYSYRDGYLLSHDDGLVKRDRIWTYQTYIEFDWGVMEAQPLSNYMANFFHVVSEDKLIGATELGPWGPASQLSYLEYNGNTWTQSESIDINCSYMGDFFLDNYCIIPCRIDNSTVFNVFDLNLNNVYTTSIQSNTPNYLGTITFDNKLIFKYRDSNTIDYHVFSSTVPNANDSNPPIKSITTQCYPNPFNPETTIEFFVPDKGLVTVEIFNILGQKVKSIIDTELEKGKYSIKWNGQDDKDLALSSGVYFYRVSQKNVSATNKIVMLK